MSYTDISKDPLSNCTFIVYNVSVVVDDLGNISPLDHYSKMWIAYNVEAAYMMREKNPLSADE